ncbi:hypothetical protein H0W26_01595 [Candidatus Dependentiae bacterium]|nr:hypothetical protein [Candidatus Dependentiae bacterium]
MKKIITPLLGLILLHSPFTQPHFSDGLVVGGLAGLTAGLVTTALANQCAQPEVIVVHPCPLRQCTACGPQAPCGKHRPGARTQFKRLHTKVKRRKLPRRRPNPSAVLLRQQEHALHGSLKQLQALQASIYEESKRVELMIRDMELRLRETKLSLQRAA